MSDRTVFRRWVIATWLGWVLGIPIIVALALTGEAVGIGGAQVIVGVGMGTGIGLTQGRAMRRLLEKSTPWFWSCAVGLGVPFLAVDIAKALGRPLDYWLGACVALGGLIVGVWQASILRSSRQGTAWWVVGSVVGWSLAGAMSAVADTLTRSQSLRGIGGALAFLGTVAGGGWSSVSSRASRSCGCCARSRR